MIISPTITYFSSLTPASDYTVTLPDAPLNLESPKTISVQSTIDGGASTSIWENSIQGQERTITALVQESVYNGLKRLKDSAVDEWILRARGKVYQIVFDLASAVPLRDKTGRWRVQVRVIFQEELTA